MELGQSESQRSNRWLVALLAAFAVATPAGDMAQAVLLLALVGSAFVLCLQRPTPRQSVSLALVAITLAVWMAAQTLNPNVPDMTTALLGFRKSSSVLFAIAVATMWPGRSRLRALEVLVLVTVATSVAIHVVAPEVEASIVHRAADQYTAAFGGQARAQGLLAGPFHLAMGGSFLAVAGFVGYTRRSRWVSTSMVAVGVWSLIEARVRTGFVVTVVALILLLALATVARQRDRSARVATVSLLVLAAVAGVVVLGTAQDDAYLQATERRNEVLGSLLHLNEDPRALGRVETWREGAILVARAPVWGWGAGAAGATLGDAFVDGEHVTPHNMFLKYAVEGGIVALVLMLGIWAAVGWRAFRSPDSSQAAAFLVATGFGIAGTSVESIPVVNLLAIQAAMPWMRQSPGCQAQGPVTAEPAELPDRHAALLR